MDLKMTFLKSFSSIADQQGWRNCPALQSCLPYSEWKFQRSLECHQYPHQSVSQVSGSVSCPVTRNTLLALFASTSHILLTYFSFPFVLFHFVLFAMGLSEVGRSSSYFCSVLLYHQKHLLGFFVCFPWFHCFVFACLFVLGLNLDSLEFTV